MDYTLLLDLSLELGERLAIAGAETYRVEESIHRIMHSYGIEAEVFAIPNCLIVSAEAPDGQVLTRMRRINSRGNDLDAVENYSNLSRRICATTPALSDFSDWLSQTEALRKQYSMPMRLLGGFCGALGFCIIFGGTLLDGLFAGLCGIEISLLGQLMHHRLGANTFFRTIALAFIMGLTAYGLGTLWAQLNAASIVIGASMILVPGLLFTNAMRDIIYGDTNSGINRIVQVLLVAVAIAAGTGASWNLASSLWGAIPNSGTVSYGYLANALACFVGCIGFSIIFNIHGHGVLLCVLGGVVTWLIFLFANRGLGSELSAYLVSTLFAAAYSEVMARVRKYPAITYLVVSVFPLLPGAGIYYTMTYAMSGELERFASQGLHTAAIAGIMAVAILFGSTTISSLAGRLQRHHSISK